VLENKDDKEEEETKIVEERKGCRDVLWPMCRLHTLIKCRPWVSLLHSDHQ
jgi:hypothetical protein